MSRYRDQMNDRIESDRNWQKAIEADPKLYPFGACLSCGCPLLQAKGYAGTDLCGPCCTGEADTVDEITTDDEET